MAENIQKYNFTQNIAIADNLRIKGRIPDGEKINLFDKGVSSFDEAYKQILDKATWIGLTFDQKENGLMRVNLDDFGEFGKIIKKHGLNPDINNDGKFDTIESAALFATLATHTKANGEEELNENITNETLYGKGGIFNGNKTAPQDVFDRYYNDFKELDDTTATKFE